MRFLEHITPEFEELEPALGNRHDRQWHRKEKPRPNGLDPD